MSRTLIRQGSEGPVVHELSRILVDRDFFHQETTTFDRPLHNAVREFQMRHLDSTGQPLVVDGVVGPLTWWALDHSDNSLLFSGDPQDLSPIPSGGSGRGRAALAVALAEMAAAASEVGSNNSGPWVEKYLKGIAPTPANWCAAFVSWCLDQHPDGCPYPYSLGARDVRNKFRDRGWLVHCDDDYPPQPGDLAFWWRGMPNGWKGHVGIVHHYENGYVWVVEGNKGGFPARVRVYSYVVSRMEDQKLLGWGRIS